MEVQRARQSDDSEIRNLYRLLSAANQEKELAYEMYRTSVQTIENLEEELETSEDKKKLDLFKRQIREVQHQMQSDYSEAINILENKLETVSSDLQFEIEKNNKKSEEIVQLTEKVREVEELERKCSALKDREIELAQRCLTLEAKCLEYEMKLQRMGPNEDELEREMERLNATKRQLLDMQAALERTQATAESLAGKEAEARSKVAEAIGVAEAALTEKQQTSNRLVAAERECQRLQQELLGLIEEAGLKVAAEVHTVRREFESQMKSAISQMSLLEKDRDKKLTQIESLQAELGRMESELRLVKEKSVSARKFQALTNRLDEAEAKFTEMEQANWTLNECLLQNQQRYESELSKYDIERAYMETRIRELNSHLDDTALTLQKAIQHSDLLTEKLNAITKDFLNERDANQSGYSELVYRLKNLQTTNSVTVQELQEFVDAHNSIAAKWKNAYEHLMEKFKNRLRQMKSQLKVEKENNKELVKHLEGFRSRLENSRRNQTRDEEQTDKRRTHDHGAHHGK